MRRFILILTACCACAFAWAQHPFEQRDGYRVTRVEVGLKQGNSAAGYLLIPDSIAAAGAPAVLLLHDHGAWFSIGKEKMVCPLVDETAAKEERLRQQYRREDAVDWVRKYYDGAFLGDSLARAGYVVLAMDALYWGERAITQPPYGTGRQALKAYNRLLRDYQSAFFWQTLAADRGRAQVWAERILADDRSGLDYLSALPYVNPKRIGCVGFSMGAYRAWNLAAEDSRVAVCVAAHWMTTIEMNGGTLTNASSYSMYRPAVYPLLDYPEVAAQMAPRPLLLTYGTQDPLFPPAALQAADSVIRKVYRAQGADSAYWLTPFAAAHRFTTPERQLVFTFLRTYL